MFPKGIPLSKRIFDLLATVIGMMVISPVLLVITALVWSMHGRPVLFRQLRPGYQGEPFWVYKFRSMTEARDKEGSMLPEEKRLTRLGRFLRATSLDELAELINVLRGEMSLVGPRPLLMGYLERYTPEQARRHEVLPGITGWAQINGRNSLNWEERFRLDVWYVDHWSFWLDIKILLITLEKVLKREGIDSTSGGIMDEFMGNQELSKPNKNEGGP
jgi:sugar transferase EpsL